MSKKMADSFVGVYPVSKTLRFELKPVGRTLEYIERDGVIDTDFLRSQNYIKVKKLIDEYHKAFIQKVLEKTTLVGLEEYVSLYPQISEVSFPEDGIDGIEWTCDLVVESEEE